MGLRGSAYFFKFILFLNLILEEISTSKVIILNLTCLHNLEFFSYCHKNWQLECYLNRRQPNEHLFLQTRQAGTLFK